MSNPKLLLCDEISLGLAPIVVRDIYGGVAMVMAQGTSLVLVEQDVVQALKATQRSTPAEGRVALRAGEGLTRGDCRGLFRGLKLPPHPAAR